MNNNHKNNFGTIKKSTHQVIIVKEKLSWHKVAVRCPVRSVLDYYLTSSRTQSSVSTARHNGRNRAANICSIWMVYCGQSARIVIFTAHRYIYRETLWASNKHSWNLTSISSEKVFQTYSWKFAQWWEGETISSTVMDNVQIFWTKILSHNKVFCGNVRIRAIPNKIFLCNIFC